MAKPIKLLDNADQIITLLSEIGSASSTVIASEIGVPRSSVYRLLEGLAAAGLVRLAPSGQVRLSERWLHLGHVAQKSFSEWQAHIDRLDVITADTGYTSFLSIPTASDAACIAWSPASNLIVLSLRPGRRLPFNVGAAGRLLFALSPEDTRDQHLAHCSFPGPTEKSIATREELISDASLVREHGWILSDEDVTPGISAVGIPVHSEGKGLLGCISVSGLAQDLAPRAEEIATYLLKASKPQ
jgi:IclR family acetate operon transcriptional repressor